MSNQLVVTIKTTRYLNERNKDGSPKDEVINVKLIYNNLEYHNFLKNMMNTGINKAELISVKEQIPIPLTEKQKEAKEPQKYDYKEVSIPDEIRADIANALKVGEPELTPEQKKIAELEAAIEELKTGKRNEPPVKQKPASDEIDPELKAARKEYYEVFGKKGHHSWDVATIKAKIEEAK